MAIKLKKFFKNSAVKCVMTLIMLAAIVVSVFQVINMYKTYGSEAGGYIQLIAYGDDVYNNAELLTKNEYQKDLQYVADLFYNANLVVQKNNNIMEKFEILTAHANYIVQELREINALYNAKENEIALSDVSTLVEETTLFLTEFIADYEVIQDFEQSYEYIKNTYEYFINELNQINMDLKNGFSPGWTKINVLEEKVQLIQTAQNAIQENSTQPTEYVLKTEDILSNLANYPLGGVIYNFKTPTDSIYNEQDLSNFTIKKFWQSFENKAIQSSTLPYAEYLTSLETENYFYFAWTDEKYDSVLTTFNNQYNARVENKQYFINDGILLIVALVIFLLMALLLLVFSGRTDENNQVKILGIDKILFEFGLLLIIPPFLLGEFAGQITSENSYNLVEKLYIIGCSKYIFLCFLFLMAVVKNFKAKRFAKYSITTWLLVKLFKVLKFIAIKLVEFCKNVYFSLPYSAVFIGIVVVFALLGLINKYVSLFISIPAIAIVTIHAFKMKTILDATKKISDGQDVKLTASYGYWGTLSKNLSELSEGQHNAVQTALRSERMKNELITNVSHDIRTPLTSLITYIDLLKKGDSEPQQTTHYIEKIEQKAARLKTLTDDLFEVSKANSGNVTPIFDKINLQALVTQALGELTEKVEASGLDFRISGEETTVYADGRMTFRIIENLLSNIFKYSMPNSRVYITTSKSEVNGVLQLKNISFQPLTVKADELSERFVRGDESRSSEGSGLGLSIVKSFVALQNGKLKIETDGDLFKVTIALPLVIETPQIIEQSEF